MSTKGFSLLSPFVEKSFKAGSSAMKTEHNRWANVKHVTYYTIATFIYLT